MKFLHLFSVVGLSILLGCNRTPPENKSVIAGGYVESGQLTVSNPNLIEVPNLPIIGFATVESKGSPSHISYFFIAPKPKVSETNFVNFLGSTTNDGETAKSESKISFGGHEVQFVLKVDQKSENLTIGKSNYDLSKGRIFLLDVSADSIQVEQVDAELPDEQSTVETTDEAVDVARTILEKLIENSPVVAEFVEKE